MSRVLRRPLFWVACAISMPAVLSLFGNTCVDRDQNSYLLWFLGALIAIASLATGAILRISSPAPADPSSETRRRRLSDDLLLGFLVGACILAPTCSFNLDQMGDLLSNDHALNCFIEHDLPVYPQAFEMRRLPERLVYATSDDPAVVRTFYRERLEALGFELVDQAAESSSERYERADVPWRVVVREVPASDYTAPRGKPYLFEVSVSLYR